ncbi:hypothetical protein GBC55_006760 [Pseudomonas sp. TNT3]|nr:hypothetical protein [Pseudomonas sp. TNT3]KAI2693300.1 hypothetical protein GBC55_006760 [Pseudomonas sp. TNT3]
MQVNAHGQYIAAGMGKDTVFYCRAVGGLAARNRKKAGRHLGWRRPVLGILLCHQRLGILLGELQDLLWILLMAKFSKDSGQLLFDTDLICYGLIKSGSMAYQQSWTRRYLRSAQLDPNNGANWTASVVTSGTAGADSLYGFTVYNSLSPIVFITGPGCMVGSARAGAALTFFYSNADSSTRFYCFDLMQDNIPGGPYLKTRTPDGVITFNSLQPPVNVIGAVQAPGPGGLDRFGRYITTYGGGYNRHRQAAAGGEVTKVDSVVDIGLAPGIEYAAYLPWSRTCGISDLYGGNAFPHTMYSGSEGAYGRVGGISFMFGATGGTTQSYPQTSGYALYYSFFNLPTDRFPVALIITTGGLPFPYN